MRTSLLITFNIWGSPFAIIDLPNALLLRGEEGEWDPALASKEDKDVALPFSDLGLCLGTCTCNPAFQGNTVGHIFVLAIITYFTFYNKKLTVSPWEFKNAHTTRCNLLPAARCIKTTCKVMQMYYVNIGTLTIDIIDFSAEL